MAANQKRFTGSGRGKPRETNLQMGVEDPFLIESKMGVKWPFITIFKM